MAPDCEKTLREDLQGLSNYTLFLFKSCFFFIFVFKPHICSLGFEIGEEQACVMEDDLVEPQTREPALEPNAPPLGQLLVIAVSVYSCFCVR